MKIRPNILKNFPAGILGVLLALIFATSAQAQVLIVDVTHPDAVVITATGFAPTSPFAGNTFFDGIDLTNFFTGDVPLSAVFTASPTGLTTDDSSSGPLFDTAQSTFAPSTSDTVDLNLYSSTSGAPETFTADVSAFTGSLTLNLTGQPLPSAGTSHAVLSGFSDGGTPIGSYLVVVQAPEPSTWTLIVFGFITLAVVRSRRARA